MQSEVGEEILYEMIDWGGSWKKPKPKPKTVKKNPKSRFFNMSRYCSLLGSRGVVLQNALLIVGCDKGDSKVTSVSFCS